MEQRGIRIKKSVLLSFVVILIIFAFPQKVVSAATYPNEVQEIVENGYYKVIKYYSLSEGETPEEIPTAAFTRDGMQYQFTDIIKKENYAEDKIEKKETVTLNTSSANANDIVSQLAPTLEYDKEGYKAMSLS